MPQLVVGTAGHIDHGKTSLVRALTGTDTDRLREEKERGMTIDLGFAYLNQSITIIDVPGHEKFIRNMAAGASNIHYGLIVVAADDGVMPQTVEHLDILTLLGVNKGWVAITKIDIVNDKDWIDLVELDIQECLSKRGFDPLSINRINNLTSDGIEALKSNMLGLISDKKDEYSSKYFRMNVDRVFSKTGFGTVVTGTVLNGMAIIGDDIEIFPEKIKTKIRGLQSHGGNAEKIVTGDRAAINLSNINKDNPDRESVSIFIKVIKSKSPKIKNSSGKILEYKINLNIQVIVKNFLTGDEILSEIVDSSSSYKVQDQYFETTKFENRSVENLINNAYEELLIKLSENMLTK